VQHGRPGVVRRRPVPGEAAWWDIAFFPVCDEKGTLGILGKIVVAPRSETPAGQPLPEKLLNIRQRFVSQFDLLQISSSIPIMQRVLEQARLASSTRAP